MAPSPSGPPEPPLRPRLPAFRSPYPRRDACQLSPPGSPSPPQRRRAQLGGSPAPSFRLPGTCDVASPLERARPGSPGGCSLQRPPQPAASFGGVRLPLPSSAQSSRRRSTPGSASASPSPARSRGAETQTRSAHAAAAAPCSCLARLARRGPLPHPWIFPARLPSRSARLGGRQESGGGGGEGAAAPRKDRLRPWLSSRFPDQAPPLPPASPLSGSHR